MKKVELVDLSYNVGVLTAISEVVNLGQKVELERIARELRQYIKQELEADRSKDMQYGVRNFMTGQGKIMLDDIRKDERLRLRGIVEKYKCDFNWDFEKNKEKHKSYVAISDILNELEKESS